MLRGKVVAPLMPGLCLACAAAPIGIKERRRQRNASRHQGGRIMARIDRRRLLKFSGAGAIAASTGGMAGILASGRAPAYAHATTIHWLRWADFVPASDPLLQTKIAHECEEAR